MSLFFILLNPTKNPNQKEQNILQWAIQNFTSFHLSIHCRPRRLNKSRYLQKLMLQVRYTIFKHIPVRKRLNSLNTYTNLSVSLSRSQNNKIQRRLTSLVSSRPEVLEVKSKSLVSNPQKLLRVEAKSFSGDVAGYT